MATKLKNLKVTNVDFVDQGANPDAHIRLFKRASDPDDDPDGKSGEDPDDPDDDQKDDPDEPSETEKGLFKKFLRMLTKNFDNAQKGMAPGGVKKGAKLFAETMNRETMEKVINEMYDFCYALTDSLSSILCDKDLTPDSRKTMMEQSIKEFNEIMDKAVGEWSNGNKIKDKLSQQDAQGGIQKTAAQQKTLEALLEKRGLWTAGTGTTGITGTVREEYDTMKIDKSKMTQEELAVLEGFEKKYGTAEPDGTDPAPAGPDGAAGITKGAGDAEPDAPVGSGDGTIHPDVQKAITDMRAAYTAQTAELEALKKNLEIEKLTQVAKKYEPLGKKSDELAAKLYDLKKSGGTAYDDYVALLDENLALIGKSRLFGEIGSNRTGSAGIEDAIGIKATELAKSANGGMSHTDAVIKAFEENPELAAQYEQEYRRW